MRSALEYPAIIRGAIVTLLLAGPAAAALWTVSDRQSDDDPSNWVMLALVVIVVAYLAGGAAAGRRALAAPLMNGAAATSLAFIFVQGIGVAIQVSSGDGVSVLGLIFNFMLAAAIGVVGAGIGSWRGRLDVGDGEPAG